MRHHKRPQLNKPNGPDRPRKPDPRQQLPHHPRKDQPARRAPTRRNPQRQCLSLMEIRARRR